MTESLIVSTLVEDRDAKYKEFKAKSGTESEQNSPGSSCPMCRRYDYFHFVALVLNRTEYVLACHNILLAIFSVTVPVPKMH